MAAVTAWGFDPKFLTNYLFGLLIIVLYAKDKFNIPTYDKESMGPFAELSPQLLTIDARYRHGVRTYITLLLTLYTALCIIGPATFNENSVRLGFVSDQSQLWPVASATFLISSGAAKDSSALGKIEHFIRQYAHKLAYIPSAVSNLAYSIRNVEIGPWLLEKPANLKVEEYSERKKALCALIGTEWVRKIEENPRQQGRVASWARANIAFYSLRQMFAGALASEKLDQITKMSENVTLLEGLQKRRSELEEKLNQSTKASDVAEADKLLADIQSFAKEASLTIIILLSQAARTVADLKVYVEELGYRPDGLMDRSGHLVYVIMVNFFILLGALMSYAILLSAELLPSQLGFLKNLIVLPGASPSNAFSVNEHVRELLVIATGALIYVATFKVIDYLRERQLELSEWRENLQGYVVTVLNASLCAAVICILLMVLLLAPFRLLPFLWSDLAGLGQQLLFQFFVAALTAGFALCYLRQAISSQWQHENRENWPRIFLEGFVMFRGPADYIKVIHAAIAACMIGLLTHAVNIHTKKTMVDGVKNSFEPVLQTFDQNQGWLGSAQKSTESPASIAAIGKSRIGRADMIGVSCKLRQIYANVHVFDLAAHHFLMNPDHPTIRGEDQSSPADACGKVETKGATIAGQLALLKEVCGTLNSVGMFKASQRPQAASASAAAQAPPRLIVPTLFKAPEKCELNVVATEDDDEKNFLSLGNSLSELYKRLDSLHEFAIGGGNHADVAFPMLAAALIAFMFGVGCRIGRTWWLNNAAGREEMERLKQQIEKLYQGTVVHAEFEKWLALPLSLLNEVAPKEAIRYEGLKARLYTSLENRQIDLAEVVETRKLLNNPVAA